jgi:hypothetical protein
MLFGRTDKGEMEMRTGLKFVLTGLAFVLITAAMGGALAEPATVSFDPTQVNELSPGEQFTINLAIADISNLFGWQINVTFNPSVLNAVRVMEGSFLRSVNKTSMPKPVLDNSRGFVLAAVSLMPPYPSVGATGSGILANMTFSVKSSGGSTLHFDETLTYFRTVQAGNVIPIENVVRQDGTYSSGGGSSGLGGVPWEIVGGVVVVVVVVGVVGIFLLRRRRERT